MAYTINVTGLPNNCKCPKLVIIFKALLKREGVSKFWITEMADIRGTDLKSAKVEFDNREEAYRALKVLDGFQYTIGDFSYPLSARVDGEVRGRQRRSPSPYHHHGRDRYDEPGHSRYDDYSRDRSRSPVRRESTKLDLEIELLRKQRMIIEEERRLLLERKKLELVKEFGPSALKEFKYFEEDHRDRDRDRERDRRYRPERPAEYRPRRRSPPPPRTRVRPSRQRPSKDQSQIPQFFLPCKILLAELKILMEKLGSRKESFLLTKLIRSTIRKRIAVALEGKPIMSGEKIVALYREKYPHHQDEDFVKRHLNEVRACHLPSKGGDAKENEGEEVTKAEEQANNEVIEKKDAAAKAVPEVADVTKVAVATTAQNHVGKHTNVKEEPNSSAETQVLDIQEEQIDKADSARSVGSSEALTLLDKNDEDWVEGENTWDDVNNDQVAQK